MPDTCGRPCGPAPFRSFDGAQVTVMGLGRFGGGLGVTRWLAQHGADVLVTDLGDGRQLAPSVAELHDLIDSGAVRLRLGEHNVSDFTTCDLVVANPAVPRPWENRFLRAAQAAGIPITTEIRLVTERIDRRRVIGVTGSCGKSTTAAMIHHVLERAGHRSLLGGNIGGSLLSSVDDEGPDDRWVVLELSSAQLYWLGAGVGEQDAPGWSPRVAVLTNIEPNHLDWHGTFEHYAASKQNIFRNQQPGDEQVRGEQVEVPGGIPPLKVPGAHNRRNAIVAAIAVERATGLSPAQTLPLLSDFAGLPHRLQLVAEGDGGRRFYDDSKATTPAATVLAVGSFDDPSRVHLIAGGYDKKVDLSAIAALAPKIAGLYTVGATGPMIAVRARSTDAQATVIECESVEGAVKAAMERMGDEHVLLLSPGCASWDQFESYEQRGDAFAGAVRLGRQGTCATRVAGERPQSYPNPSKSSSSSPK